jgi:hypothetical protein
MEEEAADVEKGFQGVANGNGGDGADGQKMGQYNDDDGKRGRRRRMSSGR